MPRIKPVTSGKCNQKVALIFSLRAIGGVISSFVLHLAFATVR
jgi:hypothetical protein